MPTKTLHFVYLHPEATGPYWSTLHRFLHPHTLEAQGRAMMIVKDLEPSFPGFLGAVAADFGGADTPRQRIHFPGNLVELILEAVSQHTPPGFVDPSEYLDKLGYPNDS